MGNPNLRDYLIAAGHMTETGATRRARVRRCSCGEDVIVGLDAEVGAFEVKVDPEPLTELGEAMALLEGRRTLTARRAGRRIVLDVRDQFAIAVEPAAATSRQDVHRQHRCHTPPMTGAAVADPHLVVAKPAATDQPGF